MGLRGWLLHLPAVALVLAACGGDEPAATTAAPDTTAGRETAIGLAHREAAQAV
mgnify:CR=1 FL=1